MQAPIFSSDEYGFPFDLDMQKSISDTNDSSSYDYIPEIPRMYLRSHIFGGSHLREQRKVLVYDLKSKCLTHKVVSTPKLQERVYLEILWNAVDNAFKSQRMGQPATTLDITMNADTISVRSTGIPIPVDIHKYFYSQGQFGTVAELIFGVIGAGGNTDDSKAKQSGGINGYGAKLCNVFSRYFELEIGDNIRGFHQKIIWRKNMTEKVSSVLTPSTYGVTDRPDEKGLYHIYPIGDRYTGENFVKITWKQDMRKFGANCFIEEDRDLYMKYAVEASYIAKLKVTFNDHVIDCKTASQFVNMLPKSLVKNAIVHYELPQNVGLVGKQLDDAIATQQIIPTVELIILDTPGQDNMHISYCNGVYNALGGCHTDEAYKELLKVIKEIIQGTKGFDKGLDLSKLTIKDIKPQCTIIINYRCNDPSFLGQDKEKLLKPSPKINFTADEILKIKKFNLVNAIYAIISGKNLKGMGGATKGRITGDDNFRDCQWYNDIKKRHDGVMILCEGNSAGAYIRQWILGTPERTAKYAYFLLRGKFKNVTGCGLFDMMENNEIRKLVEYMGFSYGVDYRTQEGLATLRYGYIYCMVDADSDGSHIQSLVMNFIKEFFPTFLLAGRFFYVPTPVIRTFNKAGGKVTGIYYNMFDYKVFTDTQQKHHAKFFKGLASSKTVYAKEDARISPIVCANFDQLAAQAFDIAFRKGLTTERKKWISFWRDKIDIKIIHKLACADPRMMYVNIADYLNTKLVEYSVDTFSRALPSYKDGLKKSQRQVYWYILLQWDFGHSRKGEVNIESIALGAKEKAKYHHGDLTDTLARTGSNYPGSNNVPLISQEGQFGTREKQGKDIGASRYVETAPEPVISLIFDKELMDLIPVHVVEDKEVEPYWIPTKLPLHIVNGFIGLATAYSTEGVSYHPMDTIQWIINYITGQLCFPMIPWFRGFTGIVELEIFKGKYKKDKELVIEGQEMLSYYEGLTLTTKGLYQVIKERQATYNRDMPDGKKEKVTGIVRDIMVSEIPIGVATTKWLAEMDKHCDNIDDTPTLNTDTPKVILQGWKDTIDENKLKLVQRTGLCNITLIDDDALPIQMRNVYEALKLYCDNMKDLYQLLKVTRIKDLEIGIIAESKIIKLIDLLKAKQILTEDQDESYIEQQLLTHGIEYDVYKKLSRRSETKQGYAEHLKKLTDLQAKYDYITKRHYLTDWCDDLAKLYDFFKADSSYNKLQHHQYPFVPTSIENLITGKVKSPFIVKEVVVTECGSL
jgi:DNA topoisomerase-2